MSPSSPFGRDSSRDHDSDARPRGQETPSPDSPLAPGTSGATRRETADRETTGPSTRDTSRPEAASTTGTTSTTGRPTTDSAAAGGAAGETLSRRERRAADRDQKERDRTDRDRIERGRTGRDRALDADPSATTTKPVKPAALWQSDLGLLAMRLVLAASFIGHGSQKVFGAFDGTGIKGFADGTLSGYGFRHTEVLAWVTGLTELVGGVLVAVGFLTPLAAAGLLAIMVNTVVLKFHDGFFFQDNGFEIDLVLAGLAGGVLLNGPGRIALDAGGFLRRLLNQRWLFLAIGVGSALAVYFLLRS